MRLLPILACLLVALLPLAPALPQPVPQAAAGFTVTLLANVVAPTAIEFGPGGADGQDLYATTLDGSVVRVPLTWTAAGPLAGPLDIHASGFLQPLGLAWHGTSLLVADSHENLDTGRPDGRVTRVDADGARTVLVDGLPNGRHNTNHLRFAPDGRLAITNGNPNDNGIEDGSFNPPDVFPYSGAILLVDVDEATASPAVLRWKDDAGRLLAPGEIASSPLNADFAQKVEVLAHGFRNVFGVAYSPAGVAYTAMNGADEPSSQDALYRIAPGTDYRYPFCFNEGAPGAVGEGIRAVPNPVFPEADCLNAPRASALLGWHVCATGLDFPTDGPAAFPHAYRDSVYVAECGPFFPEPARDPGHHHTGHKVVRVRLDANGEAVEVLDFLTGLGLPTDVRFGPDGAMYVADVGAIWRVAPLPPVVVAAAGYAFTPPVVAVPAGTTIEWRGILLPHTVTTSRDPLAALRGEPNDPSNADGAPETFSRFLPQGGVLRQAFQTPGVYAYYCEIHVGLGMAGTIVVT